jgi:hypothetical protein
VVWNIAVPTKIPPVANAGPDNVTEVLSPVVLDGTGSTDNSGYIAFFNWSFDDGSYNNGTSSIVNHTYTTLGNFSVTLNVTDSFGNWDTDTVNISVVETNPPVTTIGISTPKYREFGGDFWNVTTNLTSTIFNLSAVDNFSGVNFTWYTINGDYFVYSGDFTLDGYNEGPCNLTWGSVDNYGNNETGNIDTMIIDNTPPDTILDIGIPRYRNSGNDVWNVTDTTLFTFITYDQYSGLDHVWYIVAGDIYPSGTTFTLAGYSEGPIPILWIGYDHVGNNQARNTWVYLDLSTPVTNITVGDPKYRAGPMDSWNITDTTSISLSHNNDGGGPGVNFTWFTIDGTYSLYTAPFTLSPGIHTLTWGSEDLLGLNETGNIMTINVDIGTPVTNLIVGSPKYRDIVADTWNVTEATPFTLPSTDLYSGINYTWYFIDGQYFVGTGFTLSGYGEGPHTLQWGSIDNLDNNETASSLVVNLDINPPTTLLNIGNPKFRGSVPDYWNVTSSSAFTLSSSDTYSGVGTIWYTIDSEYFEGILFNLLGYSDGQHDITWGAIDNLGINETGNTISVVLDNTPPTTLLGLGSPKYRLNISHNWNVTDTTPFTLTASDQYAGVDLVWYTIDGDYYTGMSFDLTGYSEGIHTITWGAIDNLGNNETGTVMVVNLDFSEPVTTIIIGPPRFRDLPSDIWNITNMTSISLSHNNDGTGSGINFTWYSIDSIMYLYTGLFTLPSGEHTITWGSQDNLGLNETSNIL